MTEPGRGDEDLVTALCREAERTGATPDWLRYAEVLARSGSPGSALAGLRTWYAGPDGGGEAGEGPHDPEEIAECLLLAARIALEANLTRYAAFLLDRVPQHSRDPHRCALAAEQADALANWHRERDETRHLWELQLDYLTERRAAGRADAQQFEQLARLTLEVGPPDRMGSRLTAALAVLDAGLAQNPDAVPLLEHQARLLAVLSLDERLDQTLQRLERLDPNSPVHRDFAAGVNAPGITGLDETVGGVARFLTAAASSSDAAEAEAVLVDLKSMLGGRPNSIALHVFYALGLAYAGRHQAARVQATLLSEIAGENHDDHFNVALVYRVLSDPVSARQHAELARRYAVAASDRRDAEELIESLRREP